MSVYARLTPAARAYATSQGLARGFSNRERTVGARSAQSGNTPLTRGLYHRHLGEVGAAAVPIVREEFPPYMSIAHELSSDVAAAMLARQDEESQRSARDLAGVVREVHTTLRQLTVESRRRKTRWQNLADASRSAGAAAGTASAPEA